MLESDNKANRNNDYNLIMRTTNNSWANENIDVTVWDITWKTTTTLKQNNLIKKGQQRRKRQQTIKKLGKTVVEVHR